MSPTTRAIVLAAGEGKRLLPFTEAQPKCLVEVAGAPLIEHCLRALAHHGCEQVSLVVGHQRELLQRRLSDHFAGMRIEYVENARYRDTNTSYSLALGLRRSAAPTWVIEGDVVLDAAILGLAAPGGIAWFVDGSMRELDGAYLESDLHGVARRLQIVRDVRLLRAGQRKSIGILKLNRDGVARLRAWLAEGMAAGREGAYYDVVVADHLHEGLVQLVDVRGHLWFEIDTPADLERACRMFQPRAQAVACVSDP